MNPISHQCFPGLRARAAFQRFDITPPLDVCAKNWGAATQWFASGIHRRLTGTVLALASEDTTLILISLELGWWRSRSDSDALRHRLLNELGLEESQLIVHLTHTHAGPALDSDLPPEGNPATARAYLAELTAKCSQAAQTALAHLQPSTMLFRYGSCGLATERDWIDPQNPSRYLTGFHPDAPADDALLVARVFTDAGATLGTLVNYACHPTTLAWENTLISPDFPGALRETVESATNGAPCLFLQGASGELAPAEQYSGDPALADRHGCELGHAALATLTPLESGCSHLRYEGPVESGAPLAVWRAMSHDLDPTLIASMQQVELRVKSDLPTIAEIEARLAQKPSGFQHERLTRQRRVRSSIGDDVASREKVWLWRLGQAALVAVPFEAYSIFQQQLRAALPNITVLVLNIANGHLGYLPPAPLYDRNVYTVWQTPFARGGLERLVEAATDGLQRLMN